MSAVGGERRPRESPLWPSYWQQLFGGERRGDQRQINVHTFECSDIMWCNLRMLFLILMSSSCHSSYISSLQIPKTQLELSVINGNEIVKINFYLFILKIIGFWFRLIRRLHTIVSYPAS